MKLHSCLVSESLKTPSRWSLHLWDGHGDVAELPSSSLWDCSGEEQPQTVFREQRLFILLEKCNSKRSLPPHSTVITVTIVMFPPMLVFHHLVCSAEFYNYWIIRPAGAPKNVSALQSGRISPSSTRNIKTITTYIRMWIIMIMQRICNSESEPSGLFLQESYDPLFMLLQNISHGHFHPLAKNRHEKLIRKNNISSSTVLWGMW